MSESTIAKLNIRLSATSIGLAKDLAKNLSLLGSFAKSAGYKLAGMDIGGHKLAKNISSALPKIVSNTKSAASAMQSAFNFVNPFESFIPSLAQMKAIGVGTFATLGAASIKFAAELEMTETAFRVLIGESNNWKESLTKLQKFAAETPFSQSETLAAGKMLLGYGFTAEQLIPTLQTVGDVAAGTVTDLKIMAYLFGTLKTSGRAMTIDINQFANRGIPIWEELAKVFNVNVTEMRAIVEEGRVGFPQVVQAFKNMSDEGGKFSGMMYAQSLTLQGMFNALRDNVILSLAGIGKVLIEEFQMKKVVRELTKFAANVKNNIDKIRPIIKEIREWVEAFGNAVVVSFQYAKTTLLEFVDATVKAFPEMTKNADGFKSFLNNLTFSMDDAKLLGVDMAETIAMAIQGLLDSMRALAQGFGQYIERPLIRLRLLALEMAQSTGIGEDTKLSDLLDAKIKERTAALRVYEKQMRFIPILTKEEGDRASAEYKDQLTKKLNEINLKYDPKINAAKAVQSTAEKIIELNNLLKEIDKNSTPLFDEFKKNQADISERFRKIRNELKKTIEEANDPEGFSRALSLLGGSIYNDASIIKSIQDEYNREASRIARFSGLAPLSIPVELILKNLDGLQSQIKRTEMEVDVVLIPADMRAQAKSLTEQFLSPVDKFMTERDKINDMLLRGAIDLRTADLAINNAFQNLSSTLNVSDAKLPEALVKNSVGAVSMVNKFNAFDGQQLTDVKTILSQSLQLDKQQLDAATRIAIAIERLARKELKMPGD